MEVFSHFQHWHDVLCSPSGVVKSVTDRTKLFRYRWRGTRISPNLFPLEESSQLWKQRAHHLCNDPSRCDAASDYDGIRVISVIGPNDDPPRWALQSGSWGEPSAPAHTHTEHREQAHLKECHCLHRNETDPHKVIISKFIWSPAATLGKMRPTAFF